MDEQRIRDEIAQELRGAHRLRITWLKEGHPRFAEDMKQYADGIRFVVSILYPKRRKPWIVH